MTIWVEIETTLAEAGKDDKSYQNDGLFISLY